MLVHLWIDTRICEICDAQSNIEAGHKVHHLQERHNRDDRCRKLMSIRNGTQQVLVNKCGHQDHDDNEDDEHLPNGNRRFSTV